MHRATKTGRCEPGHHCLLVATDTAARGASRVSPRRRGQAAGSGHGPRRARGPRGQRCPTPVAAMTLWCSWPSLYDSQAPRCRGGEHAAGDVGEEEGTADHGVVREHRSRPERCAAAAM